MSWKLLASLVLVYFLCTNINYSQDVLINEIVTANSIYLDEDRDSPDWIELYNAGSDVVDLENWSITDDVHDPLKWVFPATSLGADDYLLLWASGKDKKTPGIPLSLISAGDAFRYLIPDENISTTWREAGFDDSNWQAGASGFGYGDSDDETPINSGTKAIYLRREFEIPDIDEIQEMIFDIDYDDAFVAFINGVEIARANIAADPPLFNSTPTTDHEAQIYQGFAPDRFFIADYEDILQNGTNVLAIQAYNISTSSSDMTIIPFLSVYTSVLSTGSPPVPILELASKDLHTNFKISNGETIYLFDKQGELQDSIFTDSIPLDISKGLLPHTSDYVLFQQTTPGNVNAIEGYDGVITTSIQFSHPSGKASPFSLTMSGLGSDEEIRYTLDGSIPSDTSALYSNAVLIENTTVLRARVFKVNYIPSKVETRSYLVDITHDLPIVSLVTEPSNFFDEEDGIYVLGQGYSGEFPYFGSNIWEDVEVPLNFSLFDRDGSLSVQFDGGTKIFGGWSRANDQRSLSVFARSQYGENIINYPIFSDRPYNEYQAFVLRNSGNDWLISMMRDGVMTGLLKNADIEIQAYRPVITYLNGEYWGFYNMREKINEHFLAAKFNIDKDDINLLENRGDVIYGEDSGYAELVDFIGSNDLSIPSNYDYVQNQMDVDNFILYQVAQIYFDNRDWPGNNIKYWKPDGGLWRWILYDTDFGFGIWDANAYNVNTLSFALQANGPNWPNPPYSTLFLRKLIQNEEFRHKFINQFADELNSHFSPAKVNVHIDTLKANISSEIGRHFERWGSNSNGWNGSVQRMKTFANFRPNVVKQHILSRFSLPAYHKITIDNEDRTRGFVELNSITIDEALWSGDYFEEVPIRLKAIPKEGYKFSHWTGESNSEVAEIYLNLTENTTIYPHFIADDNLPLDIVINEINYNSGDDFDSGDWVELYNPNAYAVDISSWEFKDARDDHIYTFSEGSTIAGNGFVILSRNESKFRTVFPQVENVYGEFDFGLSSDRDSVRIFDAEGGLRDFVDYTSSAPWPGEANGNGPSLELRNPFLDNSLPESWTVFHEYGSPGQVNMLVSSFGEEDVYKELAIYPNPSAGSINFDFEMRESGAVSVEIYSMDGRKIRYFEFGKLESGRYNFGKEVFDIQEGVYLLRFRAGDHTSIGKWIKH